MSQLDIKHPPTFEEKLIDLNKRINNNQKPDKGIILAGFVRELITLVMEHDKEISFLIAQCPDIEKEF